MKTTCAQLDTTFFEGLVGAAIDRGLDDNAIARLLHKAAKTNEEIRLVLEKAAGFMSLKPPTPLAGAGALGTGKPGALPTGGVGGGNQLTAPPPSKIPDHMLSPSFKPSISFEEAVRPNAARTNEAAGTRSYPAFSLPPTSWSGFKERLREIEQTRPVRSALIGTLPGVGTAASASRAEDAFRSGNYMTGAGHTGLGLLSLVPGVAAWKAMSGVSPAAQVATVPSQFAGMAASTSARAAATPSLLGRVVGAGGTAGDLGFKGLMADGLTGGHVTRKLLGSPDANQTEGQPPPPVPTGGSSPGSAPAPAEAPTDVQPLLPPTTPGAATAPSIPQPAASSAPPATQQPPATPVPPVDAKAFAKSLGIDDPRTLQSLTDPKAQAEYKAGLDQMSAHLQAQRGRMPAQQFAAHAGVLSQAHGLLAQAKSGLPLDQLKARLEAMRPGDPVAIQGMKALAADPEAQKKIAEFGDSYGSRTAPLMKLWQSLNEGPLKGWGQTMVYGGMGLGLLGILAALNGQGMTGLGLLGAGVGLGGYALSQAPGGFQGALGGLREAATGPQAPQPYPLPGQEAKPLSEEHNFIGQVKSKLWAGDRPGAAGQILTAAKYRPELMTLLQQVNTLKRTPLLGMAVTPSTLGAYLKATGGPALAPQDLADVLSLWPEIEKGLPKQ